MWKFKQIGLGDKVTPEMYNEIIERLNSMTKVFGNNVSGQLTTQGFHLTANFRDNGIGKVSLFEIQSNATGNGVYNCRLQRLDGDTWNSATLTEYIIELSTDEVQVFNLYENEEVDTWGTPVDYVAGDVREDTSVQYRCIENHTSESINRPGSGANWATYWTTDVVDHKLDVGAWLFAWQIFDSNGNLHWAGLPVLSRDAFADMFRSMIESIIKEMFDEC